MPKNEVMTRKQTHPLTLSHVFFSCCFFMIMDEHQYLQQRRFLQNNVFFTHFHRFVLIHFSACVRFLLLILVQQTWKKVAMLVISPQTMASSVHFSLYFHFKNLKNSKKIKMISSKQPNNTSHIFITTQNLDNDISFNFCKSL